MLMALKQTAEMVFVDSDSYLQSDAMAYFIDYAIIPEPAADRKIRCVTYLDYIRVCPVPGGVSCFLENKPILVTSFGGHGIHAQPKPFWRSRRRDERLSHRRSREGVSTRGDQEQSQVGACVNGCCWRRVLRVVSTAVVWHIFA